MVDNHREFTNVGQKSQKRHNLDGDSGWPQPTGETIHKARNLDEKTEYR